MQSEVKFSLTEPSVCCHGNPANASHPRPPCTQRSPRREWQRARAAVNTRRSRNVQGGKQHARCMFASFGSSFKPLHMHTCTQNRHKVTLMLPPNVRTRVRIPRALEELSSFSSILLIVILVVFEKKNNYHVSIAINNYGKCYMLGYCKRTEKCQPPGNEFL